MLKITNGEGDDVDVGRAACPRNRTPERDRETSRQISKLRLVH